MTHLRSTVRLSSIVAALAFTAIVSAQGGGGGAQILVDQVRAVGPQLPAQGGVAMGAVQQNGSGTIVGQIVDADSGKPIPGAIVTIGGAAAPQAAPAQGRIQFAQPGGGGPLTIGGPGQNPRVLSDGDGRFAFRSLPKGAYNFTAQKPGFVDGAYGRLRPGGSSQSVDLADGENRGDVKVRLFKFASISGIVVDESGEPIVGAQIRALRRSLTAGRRMLSAVNATAQTDDRGMYRLGNLIPGEYIIAAPNVQTSTPANFQLQGGLSPDLVSTLSSPGGGLSLNTGGSPVTPDGKFLLQNNNGRTITPAQPNGRLMVYATQYYPTAASTQQATGITVRSGEERGGVDMQLRMVPALNITGHLMMPDGPAVNWGVHLVPGDTSDLSTDPDVATSITNGDGEFAFLAVPAGQYVIQTVRVPRPGPGAGAQTLVFSTGGGGGTVAFSSNVSVSSSNGTPQPAPLPTDPTLWTATPIALGNDDINDLTISLRSGFKVSGRVEFQGSAERPPADRLVQIPVTVEPADGRQKTQSLPGRVDAQGNFTTMGMLPGKYFVRIGGAPSGWTFKSAALGGTDVSETPIEIEDRDISGIVVTFNDTPTDLRGTVKSADGVADDSSAVVVFPSDNRAWMDYGINPRRVRIARTSKTGTYSFGALPAGDYYVAAFSEEFAGEWQDPRFLDQLSRGAARVTLNDAEKRTQDLTRLNARPGGSPAAEPAVIDEPAPGGPYVPEIDQLTQQTQTQAPPRDTKPAPTPTPKPATPARDTPDPGTGTASVSGVVVLEDATQSPLRRTRVTLRGVDTRAERTVTTDDMGRFAFAGIPAGNYSLVAAKAAYVQAFYGSKHAGRGPGTPLSIANGQNMTDLKLMMPRGGVITGRAIDDFGTPVPNASVRLLQYRNLSGERTLVPVGVGNIVTDDRGIYRAYGLTPGAYVVSLAPPIYGGLGSDLRMLSPNDMQAAMAAVQQGSMQSGAATPGATVNAMNRPAGGAGAAPVTPPPGKAVGYSTVYYPGTWSSLDAQAVNVSAGQELAGIDIPVHLLPMSRLEGTVIGTDGQPASGVQLTFVPIGQSSTLGNFSTLRTGPDGKFSTQNIAPGHYQLTARGGGGPGVVGAGRAGGAGAGPVPPPPPPPPPPPGVNAITFGGDIFVAGVGGPGSRLYAQQELDFAGEDVTGVTLTLQEGMTVAGKIVFAGRTLTAPADVSRLSIALVPAGPRGILIGPPIAQISPTGEFTMAGVMPGKYRLTANVPGNTGWTLKSSIIDGRDTLDDSLEIKAGQNVSGAVLTFTDQMGELSGRLIDAAGKPAPGFTILLFSTDRAYWPTGSRRVPPPIQPASDGKFRATGLPAGEYYVAAVTDLDPQDWGDPAFMDQIVPGAIKITIGDGEKKVQDLKAGGAS
jgi:protocatechuate 3,4-dioxygenase beta subunit